jgi:hypothetical protein
VRHTAQRFFIGLFKRAEQTERLVGAYGRDCQRDEECSSIATMLIAAKKELPDFPVP